MTMTTQHMDVQLEPLERIFRCQTPELPSVLAIRAQDPPRPQQPCGSKCRAEVNEVSCGGHTAVQWQHRGGLWQHRGVSKEAGGSRNGDGTLERDRGRSRT